MKQGITYEMKSIATDKLLGMLNNSDPILFYNELTQLGRKYFISPSSRSEIVLLGSLLSDYLEYTTIERKEENLRLFRQKGAEIIEIIMNMSAKEGEAWQGSIDIKEEYLSQIPQERTVCLMGNISKKISDTFSLGNISLTLRLGEITGLVGENGNGKTSLLRIIAGELQPSSGTIRYPVLSGNQLNWESIKRLTGFVKQNLPAWRNTYTLKQHIQLAATIKGIKGEENKRNFEFIVARLGLEKYQHKYWSELSGGFKLRFELARQLIWQPKLLVLDEPLANLDVKTQLIFLKDLRSLTDSISNSMAVIISSQNIYEIEKIADHIMFIRNGNPIYNGKMNNLGKNQGVRCYEIDVDFDLLELQRSFRHLKIKEIRNDTFYKIIFAENDVEPDQILQALIDQHVHIKYFREITYSTRLLFEI